MKIQYIHLASALALAGTITLSAGIVMSVLSYNEIHASPYSFTNHFVSELGWSRSSNATMLFNVGMIVVNLAFLPIIIIAGRNVGTRLGYLAMSLGIIALLAGCCIGIWPLDDLKPHIIAALTFFWAYLISVFLFTLAYCPRWNDKPSRAMVSVGILSSLLAAALVIYPKESVITAMQHLDTFQRPPFWGLAFLEWCVVFSTLLWGAVTTLVQWRY